MKAERLWSGGLRLCFCGERLSECRSAPALLGSSWHVLQSLRGQVQEGLHFWAPASTSHPVRALVSLLLSLECAGLIIPLVNILPRPPNSSPAQVTTKGC